MPAKRITRCQHCQALLFRAYIGGRGYVFKHYLGGRKRCEQMRRERERVKP